MPNHPLNERHSRTFNLRKPLSIPSCPSRYIISRLSLSLPPGSPPLLIHIREDLKYSDRVPLCVHSQEKYNRAASVVQRPNIPLHLCVGVSESTVLRDGGGGAIALVRGIKRCMRQTGKHQLSGSGATSSSRHV